MMNQAKINVNHNLPLGQSTIPGKSQEQITIGDVFPNAPSGLAKVKVFRCWGVGFSMIFSDEFVIYLWQSSKSLSDLLKANKWWQIKTMNYDVERTVEHFTERADELRDDGVALKELSYHSPEEVARMEAEGEKWRLERLKSLNDLAGLSEKSWIAA